MKVATEDTGVVSVESQDFGVLNQGGYTTHFSMSFLFVCLQNFSKLSQHDLETYESVAKTCRFSAFSLIVLGF